MHDLYEEKPREDSISREDYLKTLQNVRLIENELVLYLNALTPFNYLTVHDALQHEKHVSVIRYIIGQTSWPTFMEDYENVMYPRLLKAVLVWKEHCEPFHTSSLVTERTVLEQWEEESIQNMAFVAMTSFNIEMKTTTGVEPDSVGVRLKFSRTFPKIAEWQQEHAR